MIFIPARAYHPPHHEANRSRKGACMTTTTEKPGIGARAGARKYRAMGYSKVAHSTLTAAHHRGEIDKVSGEGEPLRLDEDSLDRWVRERYKPMGPADYTDLTAIKQEQIRRQVAQVQLEELAPEGVYQTQGYLAKKYGVPQPMISQWVKRGEIDVKDKERRLAPGEPMQIQERSFQLRYREYTPRPRKYNRQQTLKGLGRADHTRPNPPPPHPSQPTARRCNTGTVKETQLCQTCGGAVCPDCGRAL